MRNFGGVSLIAKAAVLKIASNHVTVMCGLESHRLLYTELAYGWCLYVGLKIQRSWFDSTGLHFDFRSLAQLVDAAASNPVTYRFESYMSDNLRRYQSGLMARSAKPLIRRFKSDSPLEYTGRYISRLDSVPDKHEVVGSSPTLPTMLGSS